MSTKRAGAGSLAVECDVEVPMRDGVVLRADVYRPSRGKHPALLTRLPYSKLSRWTRDVLEPTAAARQGWAVVVQDTRGCYRSGGEWEPYVNEVDDGADSGTLDFRPPGEEEADCFVADPARPVPTLGGRTLLAPPQRAGPHDQRGLSQRDDVACYHGPVLSAGIEVTGSVLAEVWAMAAPGSQVVARLLDVEPSGREWGLTDGVADLEKTPERIDLGPVSHVFAPGHRVGLQLTWSSWPRWRPAAGGTGGPVRYHVRHDSTAPSHLQLPVRA